MMLQVRKQYCIQSSFMVYSP